MDRATGTQVLRSHRPRIREALAEAIELFRRSGEPFTGAAFARHLETHGRYSEALFYVSGLRDLVDHALDAGLDLRQADRFRELLLRDLVPEGVPVELLVEVLGS